MALKQKPAESLCVHSDAEFLDDVFKDDFDESRAKWDKDKPVSK